MIALFLKSLLGALAVLLVALLSQTRNFYLAGLVPLFPTFALIAHAIVGAERGAAGLRSTALFGLFALLPYAVYLLTVFALCQRLGLAATLTAATLAWIVAAAALLALWASFAPAAA